MDYEKSYQDCYSKYYDKAELFAKRLLQNCKTKKKTIGTAINEISHYFENDYIKSHNINANEPLVKLQTLFCKRHSFYEADEIQEIFKNHIKPEFESLKSYAFPVGYTIARLIKEIAILEVEREIPRLLSQNSRLLEMFYKLNEFDEFELRYYKGLSLEDYPIYKKLHRKLYPKDYIDFKENKDLTVVEYDDLGLSNPFNNENKNVFPALFLNRAVYDCFLEYQKHIIDFYIDYSYLKKRLEFEKLIHYHKDNDFMKIVFEDMKLISIKNYDEYYVNGKLKSLSKSYSVQRQNNFNLVFNGLL